MAPIYQVFYERDSSSSGNGSDGPSTAPMGMSTGSIVLIAVGAVSIIAAIVFLTWRLHVPERARPRSVVTLSPADEVSETRDYNEYKHLNYHEKSLKDLERSLGIEREKPSQARLGKI